MLRVHLSKGKAPKSRGKWELMNEMDFSWVGAACAKPRELFMAQHAPPLPHPPHSATELAREPGASMEAAKAHSFPGLEEG